MREQRLLQVVHRVHHALKLGLVNQIERPLFTGKHRERGFPRRGDHSCGFFRRQIAARNRIQRQPDKNPQTADASALFVDLFLGGRRDLFTPKPSASANC